MVMVVVAVMMRWWLSYGFQMSVDPFYLADITGEVWSCDICSRSDFAQHLEGDGPSVLSVSVPGIGS